MTIHKSTTIISALVLGLAIGLGLLGAGFWAARAVYQAKALDRYVTVKGLAERQVKANLGVWEIDFKEVGNNLIDVNNQLERDQQLVINFLEKKGFAASEIGIQPSKVNDQLANTYGGNSSNASPQALQYRYTLTGGVRVQTTQVDLIQKVNQMTGELLKQGIALSFDTGDLNPNPSYFFTQLDQIRPPMLAEATQSARLVAEQFAVNSGSHLGGIRHANQGVFQLMGRDTGTGDDSWQNTQNQLSAVYKKVRLVTTIDYFLVN